MASTCIVLQKHSWLLLNIFSPPKGRKYYQVAGYFRGYQKGTTNAFGYRANNVGIDRPYVEGISITIGRPRGHA